jgi:hypothetical protein
LPLFLVGLLLLLLGGAWTSVEAQSYLPRLVLASGVLLLVIFLVHHASEIRFLLLQARTHAEPGPTTTLLLIALVLLLGGLLAGRRAVLIDLTGARINSLSAPTRNTLDALQGPLRMQGFFVQPSPEWDMAARYLDLYARSSPRVQTALFDPDRSPGAARSAGVSRAGMLVLSYGAARTEVPILSEEAITQGVLRVLEGRPRRVGMLSGHGEPDRRSGGQEGISAWMAALSEANIESRQVSLLAEGEVPGDLDALLIVHPRGPLYGSEVGAVRRFIEQGGGIGLWAEPGDTIGLESYLRYHAVRFPPGVIRDSGPVTRRIGLGEWTPALATNPAHPIGASLAGTFVAAPLIRPLEVVSPHSADLDIEPLLKTAPTAAVFREAGETVGTPLASGVQTAAIALEWDTPVGESWQAAPDSLGLPPIKPTARVLVFGDASMVTNRFLGVGVNRSLAVNAVHWLTWQERFLDIHRQLRRNSELKVGVRGLRTLLYLIQFGLPLLLVSVGFGTWLRRRSRS